MRETAWVLLVYKIPREPTASRATIWRKLKRLGALLLQFQARVDATYQEILDELEHEDADLVALSRKYQQARAQDYFQSELGRHARERLMGARGGFAL